MKQRFSQYMRCYERSLIFILMLFSVSVVQAQNRTVKGTVTDTQGEPIIGANVVIVGGTKGVITDLDGKYSIQVPENGAVLKFSYIGFKTKSFNIDVYKRQLYPSIKRKGELSIFFHCRTNFDYRDSYQSPEK